jgi:hypothetical protein
VLSLLVLLLGVLVLVDMAIPFAHAYTDPVTIPLSAV